MSDAVFDTGVLIAALLLLSGPVGGAVAGLIALTVRPRRR